MHYRQIFFVAATALLLGCNHATGQQTGQQTDTVNTADAAEAGLVKADAHPDAATGIPALAQRLIDAYPEQKLVYRDNHIVFPDGTQIIYDDGKEKTFEQMLDNCDIEDMLAMTYNPDTKVPAYLEDAGRARSEAFFKKMYGNSEAAVRKNLVSVNWFGQRLLFTRVNGADRQLLKVAEEIAKYPELKKYMQQSSSFYWRPVRGANRLSAHSYGMTIDICTKYSNYWLWSNRGAGEMTKGLKYENRIPLQIVKIFEKHGFIWGGRWYHYDTMHFEYRPEFF